MLQQTPQQQFPQSASDQLAHLARTINAQHAKYFAGWKQTLERAMAIGDLLIEAKRLVSHGQWTRWVADGKNADAAFF
jgi:hypothetical protein